MRNKTYYEMYDLLTQSMSLNHKMIDKIEELRSENAILYRQIEECRDTLRTLISKRFLKVQMIIRDFFHSVRKQKRYTKSVLAMEKSKS